MLIRLSKAYGEFLLCTPQFSELVHLTHDEPEFEIEVRSIEEFTEIIRLIRQGVDCGKLGYLPVVTFCEPFGLDICEPKEFGFFKQ